jgi:asparagine synthase (glutamine-hydrolysing)
LRCDLDPPQPAPWTQQGPSAARRRGRESEHLIVCGIAGVFNYIAGRAVDRDAVRRMADVMAHRGPDADGFHFDGAVGLAHRRLAIIDLSDRGRQPMHTRDGRFSIVFNGEIYNYLELRRDLLAKGHTFLTDTDTEVLLTLYALHGSACLAQLNGMFTFAIWDRAARSLFIARDRVGIKPLYYASTDAGVVFASEAKALLEYPGVSASVDRSRIDTFMTFGYVPGDQTLFTQVRKLPPGHTMTVTERGVDIQEYWDVDYTPPSNPMDYGPGQLHALLLDAVSIHLRSDVPVGVFLSGGLDSSAVVSLLSEAGIAGMKTFSVAYREGEGFDETAYARLVSERFGTEHHVLYVAPASFRDFIPDYVWHMDEPVTEAAALSLYFISRTLREHVTVALSGEGADELFAGYDIYRYMQWLERYRRVPEALRSGLLDRLLSLGGDKVRKYVRLSALPLEQRYLGVSLHDPWQPHALYSAGFRREIARPGYDALAPCYERTRGHDPLTRMLYTDLKTWLVDDLLIKADKMTMANSVELRVPFLDYRVVEFAARVPSAMKLRGRTVKWILKQAMASRLPNEILERPKVGFPTPLALMFRADLSEYLHDVLLSDTARQRGYFDIRSVERLIAEHVQGRRDNHKALWQLVVLEEWHRCFVDRSARHLAREGVA